MKLDFIYGSYLRGINSKLYFIGLYRKESDYLIRVLGTSMLVYSVIITKKGLVSCSCPLFKGMKHKFPCKHIFYILFKIFPIFKDWRDPSNKIYLNRLKHKDALVKTTESFLKHPCKLNSIELILLDKMVNKNYQIKLEKRLYQLDKEYLEMIHNPEKIHSLYFNGTGKCAICLNETNEEIKCPQCKTVYHNDCIYKWIKINPSCPLCRYPMENLVKYYRVQEGEYNIIEDIKKIEI